jgi:putative lipoic acid-binding regulatory protein
MNDPDESILKFPCTFPIKAMGKTDTDIEAQVVTIIRRHVNDLGEGATKSRLSRGGKYTSITVTIRATSRAQLDAIYQDLSDCEEVLMAL